MNNSRNQESSGITTVTLEPGHHSILYRVWKRAARTVMRPVWRTRFASIGKKASIDLSAFIVGHQSIEVGAGAAIWHRSRIEALNAGPGVIRIRIGKNAVIAPGVHIGAVHSVIIGDGVGIGSHSFITDHDHDFSNPYESAMTNRRVVAAPVRIGDNAWLGEQVIVLKGVSIGERSVIGAGSVVTKDIPPLSVAVGSPARVVRRWDPLVQAWVVA